MPRLRRGMILLLASRSHYCTPAAWMMLLAHQSFTVPNPVPGDGHFKQSLLGQFWRAPKLHAGLSRRTPTIFSDESYFWGAYEEYERRRCRSKPIEITLHNYNYLRYRVQNSSPDQFKLNRLKVICPVFRDVSTLPAISNTLRAQSMSATKPGSVRRSKSNSRNR
jgi:hypothetical protein